jgi:uncharacterized protein YqgC (DUF456 family)
MLAVVDVLVVILVAAGVTGSLLPLVPGLPLILGAALLHALATGFQAIGPGRLLILAGLTAVGYILDGMAGALGARRFGGSWWGIAGAVLGGIVGLFVGLPGLIVGPLAGAVVGELIAGRKLRESLRIGLGTFLGILAGGAIRVAVSVTMAGLTLWWIWGG